MRASFYQTAFWLIVLFATTAVVQFLFVPSGALRVPLSMTSPEQPVPKPAGYGDTRRPLEDFTLAGARDQADVRRRLAATQSISCDSAASLVYRPDVILFAAHEILRENGTLQDGVASCAFRVSTKGADGETHVEDYPILLETLDYGPLVEEGADAGDAWLRSNVDDWAVARLARPVKGIEPYQLVSQGDISKLLGPETQLVTVSPPTLNWHGKQSSVVGRCQSLMRDADTAIRYPSLLFSDCYSGRGGSGGAVLADDGRGGLRYLGTMIAINRACADEGARSCTDTARALDADLVARIKGTTGPMDGAEDAPFRAAQTQRLGAARAAVTDAIARELAAPMPVSDKASSVAAPSYAKMQEAFAQGRYDAIAPLAAKAREALGGDAGWDRHEMSLISRLEGDSLLALKRPQDAALAYGMAGLHADPSLAGYLALRQGETDADPKDRREHLTDAYRIGGRTLFERFGSVSDIPDQLGVR